MKRQSRIAPPVPHAESPLRHLPLVDLLVDTKTELLELALPSGVKVFTAMLEEDRAHLVDLAPLHERRVAEGRAHYLAQSFRAIEDHEHAAIGTETTTLEIRPSSPSCFWPSAAIAQRDEQAMIAEMHPVDQQRHEVETVERRALPRRELRRRAGDEAATDGALTRPSTLHLRTERLQASRVLPCRHTDEHLFNGAAVEQIGGAWSEMSAAAPRRPPSARADAGA